MFWLASQGLGDCTAVTPATFLLGTPNPLEDIDETSPSWHSLAIKSLRIIYSCVTYSISFGFPLLFSHSLLGRHGDNILVRDRI